MFCHRDYLDFAVPGADVNFDDPAALATIVAKCTSLYAATSEKHDPAAFAKLGSTGLSARGIEVGHIFYFGTKYSEAMKAVVTGPDGDPAGVYERSEIAGQRRLVVQRQLGQVPLADLTAPAKHVEQRVLGRAEAQVTQLIVVEPADSP